jgi:PKD repeat protein
MKKLLLVGLMLLLLIGVVSAGFTALPSLIDTPSLVNIQDGTQMASAGTSVKVSADKQEFTANGITASAVPMIDGKGIVKASSLSTKEGEALIFTHTDGSKFKYEYGGDYLKESITLTEPKDIKFSLTTTALSSSYLNEDGSIVIKSVLGSEAIYILKPYVVDAGGERTDIKYTLKDGVVGFDTDFKAFKYPIVIDPTFSLLPVPNYAPPGNGYGQIAFSPDSNYLSVGSGTTPFLYICQKNLSATSNWTIYSLPATTPSAYGVSSVFSPDGNYLGVAWGNTPYLYIYAKNMSHGSNWTLLPIVDIKPTNFASNFVGNNAIDFSPDGNQLVVAGNVVLLYNKSASSLSNWTHIGNISTTFVSAVKYSPNGNYLMLGEGNSPYLEIYSFNASSSINWTILPSPTTTGAAAQGSSFSPDGTYFVIGKDNTPYINIYKYDSSNLSNWTLLPNVASLPVGTVKNVNFSKDNNYMAVTVATTPYLEIYVKNLSSSSNWTKLVAPVSALSGAGRGVMFSPDGYYLAASHVTYPYLEIYNITPDAALAPPVANLTTNKTGGIMPLSVLFNDTSTNTPTSWLWQWGDGTANGTTQNMTHTFVKWIGNSTASYNVNLTATNADGSNTTTNTVITTYPLLSNITSNVTSGIKPFDVLFNNTITNGTATTFLWNWSDGGTNGTTQNFTHNYASVGTFSVLSNISDAYSYNWTNKANYMTAYNQSWPTTDFTTNVSSGYPAYDVLFTDVSTNATSWYWSFGDGTTSTTRNLTKTYNGWIGNTSASYNVNHSATNTNGTVWKNTTANQTAYPLTSTMLSNLSSGKPPLLVQFNTTFGNGTATGWSWNFGDSNTSTTRNATNTYYTVGTFPVILNATNAYSYNWQVNATMITINALAPPVADFHATATTGYPGDTFTFTDDSTNTPTGWQWSWGDGTANGTTVGPTHQYAAIGTYTVILTATNADGSDTEVKTNYITISTAPSPPTAAFTGTPLSGAVPLSVAFTDGSTGSPASWYWDFGDGQSSTATSPTHIYGTAGTWNVKLHVTNGDGDDWENKTSYVTSTIYAPVADFSVNRIAGLTTTTFYFTDLTTHYPTSWAWDFGDGTANSTLQNPSHVFGTVGTYNITLTATNANSSDAEYKANYITISESLYPNRVAASQTVAPVDTRAYVALVAAIGGNHTPDNETDAVDVNWTGMVDAVASPYTNAMGVLAWFILLAIPFIMIWLVQGKAWVPLTIGIIGGSSLLALGYIPAEYTTPIIIFLALSVAGIFYTLWTRER